MILSDVHTHSAYSPDSAAPLADMIAAAKQKGISYYGVADHFNYDYRDLRLSFENFDLPDIDAESYFTQLREIQRQTASGMRVLAGAEFGYCPKSETKRAYAEIIERYRPDFVVNSVHTCGGTDCWFPHYFAEKSKEYAYQIYLDAVRESLEAPYGYDVVAHLGYVSRNAPYEDKKLRYEAFADALDDILRTIVSKRKILEINASARGAGSAFLPDTDILTRYFQLGGRTVSYASDAHDTARIAENRETVVAAIKRIGFTHVTVPDCGNRILLEI